MQTVTPDLVQDLRSLCGAEGRCVSIYLNLDEQAEARWKKYTKSASEWDAIRAALSEPAAKAVAVFRSDNLFLAAPLFRAVTDQSVEGRQFLILPLLAEFVRDRSFYLLALSQKDTRLLHCTLSQSEEVEFPKPDIDLPETPVASKKAEHLSHFFKQVDHGINEVLKGKREPLVLCGVEYEIPLYRAVNHYPHLATEEVRGAPNGFKGGEMHARAIEALELCYQRKVDDALAEWNHKVGSGGSSRAEEIAEAVKQGRVLTLILAESETSDDTLNQIALNTIAHAGRILVAPDAKMPAASAAAAIYRF